MARSCSLQFPPVVRFEGAVSRRAAARYKAEVGRLDDSWPRPPLTEITIFCITLSGVYVGFEFRGE
jgi:hypothetical protein